jgi:ribosome-binding protein aMBF1 (putative translation factor)
MNIIICSQCNNHIPQTTTIDQFWSHVDKLGPIPETSKDCSGNCWIWYGNINKSNYGVCGSQTNKTRMFAHRYSFELANNKKIPNDLYVCHKCDNPRCVNPNHLFLGTPMDNVQDMIKKGRKATTPRLVGEQSGKSILTDNLVTKILELSDNGTSSRQIAKIIGVSNNTISNIVQGRTWTHISGKNRIRGFNGIKQGETHPNVKLTSTEVFDIRKAYSSNKLSYKQLAIQYNVKTSTIRDIIKRYTWDHI